jgi:UDP-glucose 4-epimerase
VYHLASVVGVKRVLQEPLSTVLEGLRGTDYVLESAAEVGVPTMVASTSEVYGRLQELLDNGQHQALSENLPLLLGSPTRHRWIYAITKLAKEALAIAYHREKQAPFIVVRFFNTVGPRQSAAYGMVIPTMVQAALERRTIPVYGDGQQKRSFLHVSDAVHAIYNLLFSAVSPWGDIFNVGNPMEISIYELAQRIKDLTSSTSSIELIPYEQAYGPGFEDMRRRTPDITKIQQLIGWTPQKSLDDILHETIQYYKVQITS